MLTKKDVMITIETLRYGLNVPLFPADEDADEMDEIDEEMLEEAECAAADLDEEDEDAPQSAQMMMEGRLVETSRRAELVYHESELTGMEGASTVISFDTDEPSLVTMMRGGTVSTALIFEPHRRHICAYHTPFMPFEVCVLAHAVDNRLLGEGVLDLDYIVELRGAQAERTKFRMDIRTMEGEDPLPRPEVMLG